MATIVGGGANRGALAGGVALLVVVLLLLPGAEAGALPEALWTPGSTQTVGGCAAAASPLAHWDAANTTGHLRGSATARTCGISRGGARADSDASAQVSLTVVTPIVTPTGRGGANDSWRIHARLGTAGQVVGFPGCPLRRQLVELDLGYTWYNFSSVATSCYALATVAVTGDAYLWDRTTGAEFPSQNAWAGAFNISGLENDSYRYVATYSNASLWASNSSSSYSLNASYGATGTLALLASPTWFLNATFVAGDRYAVVTIVQIQLQSEAFGYGRAAANATADLRSPGLGATESSVTVW